MTAKTFIEDGEKLVEDTRERILAAALRLLNTGGRDAVTTRAAPTVRTRVRLSHSG